jgi:hypothetical protein
VELEAVVVLEGEGLLVLLAAVVVAGVARVAQHNFCLRIFRLP